MKKCDISEYKLNVRDLQIISQALSKYADSWREDLEEQKKIYYEAANRKDSILPADQEKESQAKRREHIEYIWESIKEMMNTEIKVSMLISFGDCIDEDDKYCMKKI